MDRGRAGGLRDDDGNTGLHARAPHASARLERLLTLEEVAALLRVHEKTVRRWLRCRRIPCVRIGSRVRFDQRDILRWITARKEG